MNRVINKRIKKKSLFISIIMMLIMIVPVFAADNELYVYDSTYKSGSLSWKMYNRLQGYDQMGTYITDVGTFTATYEYRFGGTAEGDLIYKWVWDGTKFHTPVLAEAKGPTDLTVTTAYSEEDKSLEIYAPLKNQIHGDSSTYEQDGKTYYKNPAVCDGYAELTLKVSDYYEDGTILEFTGEYNAVSKTPEDEEFYEEGTVEDGYVTLKLDRGGTYTAKEKTQTGINVIVDKGDTKITISADKNVVPENATFEILDIKEGKVYEKLISSLGDEAGKVMLLDISLYNNGAKIQPNGDVRLEIPLPEGYVNPDIYYMTEDGIVTKLEATIKDGNIIFATNHFSYYALVNPAVKEVTDPSNIEDKPNDKNIEIVKKSTQTPITADNANILILLFIIGISGVIMMVITKRKWDQDIK